MRIIIFLSLFIAITQISYADESKIDNQTSKNNNQKAVLVTGASTGIGRNITETLAAKGYFVYAGARKKEDLKSLSAIENVQGIRLDVTIPSEINAAVNTIRQQGRGLYGLVNNAGVAVLEPLIEVSEESMQFQMDVNLFGPYRVTKAFAPLIIESKGRITTTGSILGVVSNSMTGPYSMSKHAVEAFTDSLAAEMKKFDVQVSIIEPGNYNSQVISNMRKRMKNKTQILESSLFEKEQQDLQRYIPAERSQFKKPDEVAAAVLHALFDENPKTRYMVVPKQSEAEFTMRAAIKRVTQLNEDQIYSYDPETLILMLKEALQ